MADEAPTRVLIRSMHPALEGVVRLAAGSIPGVARIVAVDADRFASELGNGARGGAIVVVDLHGAAALDELQLIRGLDGDARMVVLGDRIEPGQALELLRLGIEAFVRTPDGLRDLPDILRRVARRENVIAPELERAAVQELGRSVQRARSTSGLAPSITRRQREVLELLAEGFTMRQIGRRLGISPRTVEAHVTKLYGKLAVRTRLQAIARGSSLGLLELA
jgi:DNA-binding NarL/FixJ family response regulator